MTKFKTQPFSTYNPSKILYINFIEQTLHMLSVFKYLNTFKFPYIHTFYVTYLYTTNQNIYFLQFVFAWNALHKALMHVWTRYLLFTYIYKDTNQRYCQPQWYNIYTLAFGGLKLSFSRTFLLANTISLIIF